jgi:hypothetical protein
MDLCSTGFSLWVFVLARTNPHRLKPVLLKTKPRRAGPGAEEQ